MEFTATATSTAPAAACWAALTDIADWPNWTASITAVDPVDDGGLAVGRRYRLTQPGMPVLTWTVTRLDEGEAFDWEARSPGVLTVGRHRLRPDGEGTRIDLGVHQSGPLAWLFGLIGGAKTRRLIAMEAAGLKAASESR
ncbi:MAG TPA: SRPBCC family protein [Phytomonospora sp.]